MSRLKFAQICVKKKVICVGQFKKNSLRIFKAHGQNLKNNKAQV